MQFLCDIKRCIVNVEREKKVSEGRTVYSCDNIRDNFLWIDKVS